MDIKEMDQNKSWDMDDKMNVDTSSPAFPMHLF